jgi:hypothetical protein
MERWRANFFMVYSVRSGLSLHTHTPDALSAWLTPAIAQSAEQWGTAACVPVLASAVVLSAARLKV